ncbi:hypothetical protein E4631_22275 [Hymenobacter sp. UV11]|uniref:GPW/gp25 family protein n=1 Tax=Hymenobacter sp. UV11 TaxID=1849735 RepID=UPI001061D73E|nr:GPW/gp25 family protein [Hymenobacter sp. UV11]TDN38649.1 hypothetical protein A8B98_22705 [Hymenobacter sp. UV11]TFZ63563.1 hypothetical protein E4631_22275 [Hymenobacter sp. UV11]
MSHASRFYRYPLKVSLLMQPLGAAAHPTGDLGTSVKQLLHLLLHTRLGQLRSAPDFGCAVWELEFDHAVNRLQWESTLTDSLVAAVQRYEPRLHAPSVEVELTAPAAQGGSPAPVMARWRARIRIRGILGSTQEAFAYATELHIGPLAT